MWVRSASGRFGQAPTVSETIGIFWKQLECFGGYEGGGGKFSRRCEVQPDPAGGALASPWPTLVISRNLNRNPAVSLFAQTWLLWRCRNRFTNAARSLDTNPARILFEDARARAILEYPLLAPFLDLNAGNLARIAPTVATNFSSVVLPVEMMRFSGSEMDELRDSTLIWNFLQGNS